MKPLAFLAVLALAQPSQTVDRPGGRLTEGVFAPGPATGMEIALGRALFDKLWVPAPASTGGSDGLGPLMNARSCAECHPDLGRGRIEGAQSALTLRLMPPDPVLGAQVQTRAVPGLAPETGAALATGVQVSPRLAPSLAGMGLIAAIPPAQILALADPDDRDGDGISGRAAQTPEGLGRFGLKAEETSVRGQITAALHLDLGLSTQDHPQPWGDCTPAQTACRRAAPAGDPDVTEAALQALESLLRHAPVPARTQAEPEGEALFVALGCAACHHPGFVTAPDPDPDLSLQPIRPWSDFLLHDMGPELAAGSAEWRTAPLWDLAPPYLHDGRAATLDAAIRAHGGEAASARARYGALDAADRATLTAFLESL